MKLLKALALKYMSRKLKVLTFLLITSNVVLEIHSTLYLFNCRPDSRINLDSEEQQHKQLCYLI